MELTLLISFIGASVLLTLMPGPDNLYVLTESLSSGARKGVAISLGLVSGLIVHTTIAATGLAIVIQQSELLFRIISYLGAAYMFWLAYQALGEKRPELSESQSVNGTFKWFPQIRKGFIMNVLNPKVSLFFIAFLPQFIREDGGSIALQMMVLGLIFMAQALIIFSLISVLAGRFSNMLNTPRFWVYTKWAKVIVLGLLGLGLVLS